MLKYLLIFFISFIAVQASAQQQYVLSGKITDNQGKPVSFASIYIRNTTYGTSANEEGQYQFKLQPGTYTVVYRYVGYIEKTEHITIGNHNVVNNEQLQLETFQLQAVTINGDTTDPGTRIMRQVIGKREYYLNQVKQYSCAVYVKSVQRLISAPKTIVKNKFLRRFRRRLQIDTNGRGVIYQSESLSSYSFEQPSRVKEVTIASKIAGQNNSFSYNRASDLQVNFYQNSMLINGVSARAFVSPVADEALKHYNYKLVGTSVENGRTIYKVLVMPIREHDAAYRGFVYVVAGDWRIYSVDLYLTKQANVNFIDTLNISQQYVPVRDSIWMPVSVQYDFNGDALGFKFKGYYLGVYNNYNLTPNFSPKYFNGEVLRIDTNANQKSNAYWSRTRPIPLTPLESRDYFRKDSAAYIRSTPAYLDSVDSRSNKFKLPNYLIWGYQHYNRDTRESFYVYPIYQTIFYNTVQGWGINPRITYLKGYDDRRYFAITPSLRYGFSDKKFDANVSASYNYDPDHKGFWFARFGSDVLDLSNAGTRSLAFNTVSSLIYGNNYVKYYRSQFGLLGWQREISNGIVWYVGLSYANRQQLYNTSYNHIFTNGHRYTANSSLGADSTYTERALFPKNQALTFKTSLNITFDQQYETRPEGKVYEQSRLPVVQVNYRKGINNVFGSDVNYDFASIDVYQNRLNFGLAGFSAYKITFGSYFNNKSLYYMDYNHFLGNQGTVFNPDIGNFHFLPFYANSANHTFLEAHYEHNFSGYLLGQVPYLRRLKLQELVGVNYLNENNTPITNDPYFQNYGDHPYNVHNYTEVYIGIKRFFFRVDYGLAFRAGNKVNQGFRIFYGIK